MFAKRSITRTLLSNYEIKKKLSKDTIVLDTYNVVDSIYPIFDNQGTGYFFPLALSKGDRVSGGAPRCRETA